MCIVESSAYISVLQFEILKGRSFIYKINNNGLSIEPWGTPYFTGHLSERAFPICTYCVLLVQEDLNRIELWCKDNNMFINCNKTKCITVGTKQKLAFQNEELYLTINSEQLQHSACEKLLGIKIDISDLYLLCSICHIRIKKS
jgi:hypothetical protein